MIRFYKQQRNKKSQLKILQLLQAILVDGLCASYIRAFVDRPNFDFLSFTTYVLRFGLRSHELIHLLATMWCCVFSGWRNWIAVQFATQLRWRCKFCGLSFCYAVLLAAHGGFSCFLFCLFPRVSYPFLLKILWVQYPLHDSLKTWESVALPFCLPPISCFMLCIWVPFPHLAILCISLGEVYTFYVGAIANRFRYDTFPHENFYRSVVFPYAVGRILP